LQPHTRIDFTHISVVPCSSCLCFLSFGAREEVKEHTHTHTHKKTLGHKTRVFSKHECWVGTRNCTKSLIQAMLSSQLSENQF
jgi:hypothetical protein